MIHEAFKKDHSEHLRRLLDYVASCENATDQPSRMANVERARLLLARFPIAPTDARERAPKIENRVERRSALLDKHDWEPWEIGPKIGIDNVKTLCIVVL